MKHSKVSLGVDQLWNVIEENWGKTSWYSCLYRFDESWISCAGGEGGVWFGFWNITGLWEFLPKLDSNILLVLKFFFLCCLRRQEKHIGITFSTIVVCCLWKKSVNIWLYHEKLKVWLELNIGHRCSKGTIRYYWGQRSHTKVKDHPRSSYNILSRIPDRISQGLYGFRNE